MAIEYTFLAPQLEVCDGEELGKQLFSQVVKSRSIPTHPGDLQSEIRVPGKTH